MGHKTKCHCVSVANYYERAFSASDVKRHYDFARRKMYALSDSLSPITIYAGDLSGRNVPCSGSCSFYGTEIWHGRRRSKRGCSRFHTASARSMIRLENWRRSLPALMVKRHEKRPFLPCRFPCTTLTARCAVEGVSAEFSFTYGRIASHMT